MPDPVDLVIERRLLPATPSQLIGLLPVIAIVIFMDMPTQGGHPRNVDHRPSSEHDTDDVGQSAGARVDLEQACARITHIPSRIPSSPTYLSSPPPRPDSPIAVTGSVNITELVYALHFHLRSPIHARQQRGISVCPSPGPKCFTARAAHGDGAPSRALDDEKDSDVRSAKLDGAPPAGPRAFPARRRDASLVWEPLPARCSYRPFVWQVAGSAWTEMPMASIPGAGGKASADERRLCPVVRHSRRAYIDDHPDVANELGPYMSRVSPPAPRYLNIYVSPI
ncbi:hypothetical protein B0H13DRAFT_2318428 [Mycena leptocephala]|nr:hypothetical protein B0H13DRAFT_2318428 [Mycena leptocephala]